jgi:hypothetical protein
VDSTSTRPRHNYFAVNGLTSPFCQVINQCSPCGSIFNSASDWVTAGAIYTGVTWGGTRSPVQRGFAYTGKWGPMDKQRFSDSYTPMKGIEVFELAERLPPKEQCAYISSRLPEVLRETKISMWDPQRAAPQSGRLILIGLAPYALLDLRLLGALTERLAHVNAREQRLEVFDILECKNMDDLEKRIPDIGKVYHSPILGIWDDGALVQRASGAQARDLMVEYFNLRL